MTDRSQAAVEAADGVRWSSTAQRRRTAGAMRRIERRLEDVVGRVPGTLGEAAQSTLHAGGKRLRPLLVVLCCARGRPLPGRATAAAAAVELLHMATLVHDDVLDRAELRRGRPTIVSRWGPATATSVGNYLFAAAFGQAVKTADRRGVAALSAVAADLSRGELLQMNQAHRADVSADDYYRRCELKTAGLFGVSCALGASISGLPAAAVEALDAFGRRLGLAFQIFDDILDFSGDEARTGKRPGTDVRDGTVTLPLIQALERRPRIGELLERSADDEETVSRILEGVRESGALESARETALSFIEEARARLVGCERFVDVDLLGQMAGRVIDRYS